MRTLILTLGLLLLAIAGRADDFPTDFPPTFKFHETYRDTVIADPDFPGDYLLSPKGDLFIQAVGSLGTYDLNQIDIFTGYGLSVGDFDMEGFLSDDENFDPTDPAHNRSFTYQIDGLDMNGDPIVAGTLSIGWQTGRVTISFNSHNATDQETVVATDYYPDVNEPNIDRDDLIAAFSFGPYSLDLRSVYLTGSASANPDPQGRVPDNLSVVDIYGAMDSVLPTVTITSPAAGSTLTVEDAPYPPGVSNIIGTVADTRSVNGVTFPGAVNGVEVRLGTNPTDGTFVAANVDANGNWILPNVPLVLGKNYLTVRAFDEDGNTTTLSTRSFTYSLLGPVTVTAAASGYAPADTKVAGTVTGSFFKVGSKKLTLTLGQTPPKDTTIKSAGTSLTVVATPGVGSVFNGWTGTINGNPVLNEVTSTLTFDARPNLILTANFTPNPFTTAIVGKYNGLVTGTNAAGRGTFSLALTKTGLFTGTFKVGALVLPVKGVVLGNGLWKGTVKKSGKSYDITLNLNVGLNGDRQIGGTLSGNGLNSAFTINLNAWKKKTNESAAYAGGYTVLLPASANNVDANFPQGIGYGKVTIGKVGTVTFVGKLGDGSAVTASTTLVKLTSGAVSFPLHIALDKSLGNVSGTVLYDNTQTTTDLTGTLEWAEPVSGGVEPQTFNGQISLQGSLYTKPATGTRVIFESGAGSAALTLAAPLFSKPTTTPAKVPPSALGPMTFPVSLTTANTLGPVDPQNPVDLAVAKQVKLKINATTGLITGSYYDPVFKRAVLIFGAASRKANMAGGVFVRGNRAGQLLLSP